MPIVAHASDAVRAASSRAALGRGLLAAALALGPLAGAARAEETIEDRSAAVVPELETYIAEGMAFDVPGLAIGIVSDDRLVYAKGFGVRRKGGGPVDPGTVF